MSPKLSDFESISVKTQIEVPRKDCNHKFDIVVLLIYACALITIMHFHEPWFDEAQAWLIARDASVRDLLLTISHYEGHPPVWILLLMPLAKLGVPFEIGIKSLNFFFAVSAMGLFIFKSPFKRVIRYTIPFTYFFFYQYGVISRPYSLMMLAFVLCALTYKTRNTKPYHFVGSLAILCGSSAYGMVIAGGISLVWLSEILKERPKKNISVLLENKRLHALFILIILNFLFVLCIYPYKNTYGINLEQNNPFQIRLLYILFMAPADAFCVTSNYGFINVNSFSSLFIGCIISFSVFMLSKVYKKTYLFLIPYLLFAIFSAAVYFHSHHIGVIALFYMFLFWCMLEDKPEQLYLSNHINKIHKTKLDLRFLKYCYIFFIGLFLLFPLYWTISASIHEITVSYNTGRETAHFIKENKLDRLKIMAVWKEDITEKTHKKRIDFSIVPSLPILAYFGHNIFYNFNFGAKNKCYVTHEISDSYYISRQLARKGYPDVLLGKVDLKTIFGSSANLYHDYALVYVAHGNMIWKDRTLENEQQIYLRRDLLKKYPKLKEINPFQ